MILVLMNAHIKPRAALLYPDRRLAAVSLDQASNIADALALGNNPRLSENPGGQLRNRWRPPCNSLIFLSHAFVVPESPDRQMIGSCGQHRSGSVLERIHEIRTVRKLVAAPGRGISKGLARGIEWVIRAKFSS
jgi:hypothetical protein